MVILNRTQNTSIRFQDFERNPLETIESDSNF